MAIQFLLMLSLRSHYIIDMVSGVVFAHYFFILTRWYVRHVDKGICGLTVDEKQEQMNQKEAEPLLKPKGRD